MKITITNWIAFIQAKNSLYPSCQGTNKLPWQVTEAIQLDGVPQGRHGNGPVTITGPAAEALDRAFHAQFNYRGKSSGAMRALIPHLEGWGESKADW